MDDGIRRWLFGPVMRRPVASRVALPVATAGAASRTPAPHGKDTIR